MKFPEATLEELEEAIAERKAVIESNWPKQAKFALRMDDEDELEMFLEDECGLIEASNVAAEIKQILWGDLSAVVTINKDGGFTILCTLPDGSVTPNEVSQ